MTDSFPAIVTNHSKKQQEAIAALRKVFIYLHGFNPELHKIVIEYTGSGDSGQVESMEYLSKSLDSQPYPVPRVDIGSLPLATPLPLDILDMPASHWRWDPFTCQKFRVAARDKAPEEVLDAAAWDLAYGQNPGFEINEGGYGEVIISLRDEYEPSDTPLVETDILVRLKHSEIIETTNDYEYDYE